MIDTNAPDPLVHHPSCPARQSAAARCICPRRVLATAVIHLDELAPEDVDLDASQGIGDALFLELTAAGTLRRQQTEDREVEEDTPLHGLDFQVIPRGGDVGDGVPCPACDGVGILLDFDPDVTP